MKSVRTAFFGLALTFIASQWAGPGYAAGSGEDSANSAFAAAPALAASAAYKLIGWNDLGMHCLDGKDYGIFAVLPPYNTIHANLIDFNGKLVKSGAGYSVTYEAVTDPLTNSMNKSSAAKTNFWQYALQLGFGVLKPDQGLKGAIMPGSGNTPQPMTFTAADNTFVAEGIPIVPYPDSPSASATNYFPMMRLVARNTSGAILASTDIVLPTSDEMTCNACHSSSTGTAAARPAAGWVGHSDPAKDVKLNILRKHDDRFKTTALFQQAARQAGYNTQGLEPTVSARPVLCASCHASNALGAAGVSGVKPLTTAMHSLHATVVDPATNAAMDSSKTRDSCSYCHPGPKTQCYRGAMAAVKNTNGSPAIECQSCHGSMRTVGTASRKGWLDEPNCQSCHTGTAVRNSGQIAYTSVFLRGATARKAANPTFATNPNTPAKGLSLYRFSKGHGGLQCEACHGSTHAEYPTPILNDNVQSVSLQGHSGQISECAACHSSTPRTTNGGPHGLHPIGQAWVSGHEDAAEHGGAAQCKTCHGANYRGTVLSKALASRSFRTERGAVQLAKGTIIGCYTCHNGPNP